MADRDQDPVDQTTFPSRVESYRRQQKALRRRTADLDRMRAEVLAAAESEAAAIVVNARAEVRRVLVESRRRLLELSRQIDALPNSESGWPQQQPVDPRLAGVESEPMFPDEDSGRVADTVLRSRRDLIKLVADARPELDRLRDAPLHAEPLEAPLPADPAEHLQRDDDATTSGPIADVPAAADGDRRVRTPSSRRLRSVLLACVVGLIVVLGALLWDRFGRGILRRDAAPALSVRLGDTTPIATIGRARPPADVSTAVSSAPAPVHDVRPAVAPPPSPRPPTSAPADERAATRPLLPPPRAVAEGGADLTAAAQRWLDAYYRHDTTRMAAIASQDLKISDQRAEGERPPAGLANVRRTLDQVKLQSAGESTILTARMVEQTEGVDARRYLSWISQVWLHDADAWRLMDVRIVTDALLKQQNP